MLIEFFYRWWAEVRGLLRLPPDQGMGKIERFILATFSKGSALERKRKVYQDNLILPGKLGLRKMGGSVCEDADGCHKEGSLDGKDQLIMGLSPFMNLDLVAGIDLADFICNLIHFGLGDVLTVEDGNPFTVLCVGFFEQC